MLAYLEALIIYEDLRRVRCGNNPNVLVHSIVNGSHLGFSLESKLTSKYLLALQNISQGSPSRLVRARLSARA